MLPPDSIEPHPIDLILNHINPIKDVDGLAAVQVSRLVHGEFSVLSWEESKFTRKELPNEAPLHVPCAALACLRLLKETGLDLTGRHCTIVGYGRLIGVPLISLLAYATPMTFSLCTALVSPASQIADEVSRADVVISGVGVPNAIRGEWIRQGAVVLDCGINYILPKDHMDDSKRLLVGDVEFEEAAIRAAFITPVPGGVGPVTVAMLMQNTLNSAKWFLKA